MFNRVVTFGRDNAADFSADSKATAQFAQLSLVPQQVQSAQIGQQGGRATARAVLIDGLRLDLKNLARTAREIDGETPGFADKFRMPTNAAQTVLLAAAHAMVAELKKEGVASRFLDYELPGTFVADLEADLKAIGDAKDDQNSHDTQGVENTAALSMAIDAGLTLVGKLNAAMNNKYSRNPAKLAAWHSASHIERTPRRGKTTETPVPANATPAATAPVN